MATIVLITFFTLLVILGPSVTADTMLTNVVLYKGIVVPSVCPFAFYMLFVGSDPTVRVLGPFSALARGLFGLGCCRFALFLLSLVNNCPLKTGLVGSGGGTPIVVGCYVGTNPTFVVLTVKGNIFGDVAIK